MSSSVRTRAQPRRIRFVPQVSLTECGVACLAMVLRAWGTPVRLSWLRKEMDVGRDGTTVGDLVRQTRELGYQSRAIRASTEALSELQLPLILHWRHSHFVILESIDRDGAVIIDPADSKQRIDRAELEESFTGIAVEMKPGVTDPSSRANPPAPESVWSYIWGILGKMRKEISHLVLLSFLLQFAVLLPPLITSFVIDNVTNARPMSYFWAGLVAVALMAISFFVFTFARFRLLNFMRARFDRAMMSQFFHHLLSLPLRYFHLRTSGDIAMRVASNAQIRDVLTSQAISLVVDGLFVIVYATIIVVLQPLLGVAVLVCVLLQAGLLMFYYRRLMDVTVQDVQSQASLQSLSVETVAVVENVKAMGLEPAILSRWNGLLDRQIAAGYRRGTLESSLDSLLSLVRVAAPLLFLSLSGYLVIEGSMSLGVALGLNALAGVVMSPVTSLVGIARQFQLLRTQVNRIVDVMDEEPERTDEPRPAVPDDWSSISLYGATVRLGGSHSPSTLDGVTLSIARGDRVALVGPTGSGKSTLARTILGLHPLLAGRLEVGGLPIDGLDLADYRRRIGYVSQKPVLVSGTIRDNILFGDESVTEEEMEDIARTACILDEIRAMPMGFDTTLEEGGLGLSGGQQQRISLARALVRAPEILILDEATSFLDTVTEQRITENLMSLQITQVVIAHRLSTVRDCDAIHVMRSGVVIGSGSHSDLVARNLDYRELVQAQLSNP